MIPAAWDEPGATWDDPSLFWDFANRRPAITPVPAVAGAQVVAFTPSASANFQFQATFDGQPYTIVVTWNLFGQRYYVSIYSTAGELVLSLPLVGSPVDFDISLTAGYFTTSLVYRVQSGAFEIFG